MKPASLFTTLLLLLTATGAAAQSGTEVEMADLLHSNGRIYVVVGVLAIIFLGIIAYLVSLDRKLNRLEKQIQQGKQVQ
jgi:CcmD family protein